MSMQTDNFILKEKWEKLSVYIFSNILNSIPNNEKYTLGSDIRCILWDTDGYIVQVASKFGDRKALLEMIDVNAKKLLSMIKLGIDINAIPRKRHEPVSKMLVEIGKIVGGLMKTA